jgi:hypothetical protein
MLSLPPAIRIPQPPVSSRDDTPDLPPSLPATARTHVEDPLGQLISQQEHEKEVSRLSKDLAAARSDALPVVSGRVAHS